MLCKDLWRLSKKKSRAKKKTVMLKTNSRAKKKVEPKKSRAEKKNRASENWRREKELDEKN